MKDHIAICAVLALTLTPGAVRAAEASVTLTVHHAGCVLCGPIVKSTLAHVNGVSDVSVSQANGDADVAATVVYDEAQTSPAAMIKATTERGYPAEVAKAAKN